MDAKLLVDRLAQERAEGHRVSSELQQLTLAYAEQRRSAGASWKAIGAELGMSWHTLLYWRHGQRATKRRGHTHAAERRS